ncbi:MAG: putative zinc-binding metallopeptidase [Woeseiaceae bacterium]|nr:putative zinc-binding metallopeptidase [Woeseiaceae bacterium]
MKPMQCRCGQTVFFDSFRCLNCGRRVAFDAKALDMRAEERVGSGIATCANRRTAVRCNWLPKAGADGTYCLSCAMSRTIPTLEKPENHQRWRKLEAAKRRLVYDLLNLGLPVDDSKLAFEFKEDRRTNPNVSEHHVTTGHSSGIITVNAAEADEVFREKMRQKMNEPWRTLLGHLRHESGHYYFGIVVDDANRGDAHALFGDESEDYEAALADYYSNGPAPDWHHDYISAYASAHPAEDWAETWAHYLHIRSVLEVATEAGMLNHHGNWYDRFIELVLTLNEIMRALGLPDAYPFVLTPPVAKKIEFVHRAIARHAV